MSKHSRIFNKETANGSGVPFGYHQDNNVFSKKHGEESYQMAILDEETARRKYGRVNLLQINAKLKDSSKQL